MHCGNVRLCGNYTPPSCYNSDSYNLCFVVHTMFFRVSIKSPEKSPVIQMLGCSGSAMGFSFTKEGFV